MHTAYKITLQAKGEILSKLINFLSAKGINFPSNLEYIDINIEESNNCMTNVEFEDDVFTSYDNDEISEIIFYDDSLNMMENIWNLSDIELDNDEYFTDINVSDISSDIGNFKIKNFVCWGEYD